MLERFRETKEAEIAALRECVAKGAMPAPFTGDRPSFVESLRAKAPPAIIAEYKRASPSKGDINLNLEPEQAAAAYARAGAGAISVLTEREYFKGNPAYPDRMTGPGLPLLRKDFILHPLQVDQTAAGPASALLLITRMLDDDMLRALLFRSLDLGLTPVTEIFDERDLRRARGIGAPVIQVNSRDLSRLTVDSSLFRRLATRKQKDEFWIAASGIDGRDQLFELPKLGYDAALIGSSLMNSDDPGRALAALLHRENEDA